MSEMIHLLGGFFQLYSPEFLTKNKVEKSRSMSTFYSVRLLNINPSQTLNEMLFSLKSDKPFLIKKNVLRSKFL